MAPLRGADAEVERMTLRVHLALADGALRRRLAALLRADPELLLVSDPETADLVVRSAVEPPLLASAAPELALDATLTPRELEVLSLLAQGLGNRVIARALDISVHTAKYHVASLLAKLGARSRTEAVAQAIRRGLVPL
jgi:DNA-binding NarL/FixJ family response regulator